MSLTEKHDPYILKLTMDIESMGMISPSLSYGEDLLQNTIKLKLSHRSSQYQVKHNFWQLKWIYLRRHRVEMQKGAIGEG